MAEMVEDIQKTKTGILRGGMDSIYLALNPRNVTSDKVVLDDLLVKPSWWCGVFSLVRCQVKGHVMPLISLTYQVELLPHAAILRRCAGDSYRRYADGCRFTV